MLSAPRLGAGRGAARRAAPASGRTPAAVPRCLRRHARWTRRRRTPQCRCRLPWPPPSPRHRRSAHRPAARARARARTHTSTHASTHARTRALAHASAPRSRPRAAALARSPPSARPPPRPHLPLVAAARVQQRAAIHRDPTLLVASAPRRAPRRNPTPPLPSPPCAGPSPAPGVCRVPARERPLARAAQTGSSAPLRSAQLRRRRGNARARARTRVQKEFEYGGSSINQSTNASHAPTFGSKSR